MLEVPLMNLGIGVLIGLIAGAFLWRFRGWGGPNAPEHPWPNIVGRLPWALTAGLLVYSVDGDWWAVAAAIPCGFLGVTFGWPGDVIRADTLKQVWVLCFVCLGRGVLILGWAIWYEPIMSVALVGWLLMGLGYALAQELQEENFYARDGILRVFFGPSMALKETVGGAIAGSITGGVLAGVMTHLYWM